jgi:hypothetical protein
MCQRRVLLARTEGKVRQVQVCKWTTTIQGSLEPLCRLTHSIIKARRRVTGRSRSLVSTSNRALASCADGAHSCCVQCATPGSAWSNRLRSCIERTRVASAAPWSNYRTAWHCGRSDFKKIDFFKISRAIMKGSSWLSAAVLVASVRTALALPALQPVHRIQLRGGQGADASSLTDNSEYAVDSRALKLLRQTNIAPK